jgi:hypothetical protein
MELQIVCLETNNIEIEKDEVGIYSPESSFNITKTDEEDIYIICLQSKKGEIYKKITSTQLDQFLNYCDKMRNKHKEAKNGNNRYSKITGNIESL